MKLKIVNFFVLLVICGFVVVIQPSCTKTITQTITDTLQHAWKPITPFNLYAVSELTSASIGDSILVVGSNSNYMMLPVNGNTFNNFMAYNLIGTSIYSPAYGFPFLTGKLCAFTTSTSLNIMSVPVYNQYSNFSYTPVYTAGWYNSFQQNSLYPSGTYPSSAYPVIQNKYVLTPVETDPNNYQRVRFDLLSFDSSKILSIWGFGDTPKVKSIFLTPAPGTIGFTGSGYFCASFYNKFFVYYGGQFFRIDTAGNVKQFGYRPASYPKGYGVYNMFTVNNNLFVNSGGILFNSTDQGETWNLFNDFSGSTVGYLVFRNVGNKLYATIADSETQLFKVAITGKNLNFSELNNDGLQNNIITSITQCGKYDFITTSSGVFYRDTAQFDQLKIPIR